MATLTETAYYTRRTINWVILGIIAYFVLRIFWSLFVAAWLNIFPPKAPPPNHRFSKLPALVFPKQSTPSGQLTFRLETVEGAVPKASESASVYFLPKSGANLLALNHAQEMAQRLELDPTPIQDTKNIYHFDDPDLPLRKFRYDIVTGNFILRYGFEQDTGLFDDHQVQGVDATKAEAISLLQSFTLYNDDLIGGEQKISFLKFTNGQLTPTTSLSAADGVRVDFFRRPVDGVRVFPPNPDEGPVAIIYSGSKVEKKKLIQFAYSFWPIDYQTSGTYALKPSSLAWQELQSGGGFIARYPTSGTVATVRNVYVAYYDSYDPQTYLQPIFVFEGDYGFLGYVPAVEKEWTE